MASRCHSHLSTLQPGEPGLPWQSRAGLCRAAVPPPYPKQADDLLLPKPRAHPLCGIIFCCCATDRTDRRLVGGMAVLGGWLEPRTPWCGRDTQRHSQAFPETDRYRELCKGTSRLWSICPAPRHRTWSSATSHTTAGPGSLTGLQKNLSAD